MRAADAGIAVLVGAMTCASCGSRPPGLTGPYLERLLGFSFPVRGELECVNPTGFDYVAYRRIPIPADALSRLRADSAGLSGRPAALPGQPVELRVRHWKSGPLSPEAQQALAVAFDGARSAIERGDCRGMRSDRALEPLAQALGRGTTYHAYQFWSADGSVQAEELDFRILDLEAGALFELATHD